MESTFAQRHTIKIYLGSKSLLRCPTIATSSIGTTFFSTAIYLLQRGRLKILWHREVYRTMLVARKIARARTSLRRT
jgi:hypothetical protein